MKPFVTHRTNELVPNWTTMNRIFERTSWNIYPRVSKANGIFLLLRNFAVVLLEEVPERFAAPVVVGPWQWSAAVGSDPSLFVYRYSFFKSTTRTLTMVLRSQISQMKTKSISLSSERIVRKRIWNSPKFDENRRDALEFDSGIKSERTERRNCPSTEAFRSHLTEVSIEKIKCVAKGIRIDRRIEKKPERTDEWTMSESSPQIELSDEFPRSNRRFESSRRLNNRSDSVKVNRWCWRSTESDVRKRSRHWRFLCRELERTLIVVVVVVVASASRSHALDEVWKTLSFAGGNFARTIVHWFSPFSSIG